VGSAIRTCSSPPSSVSPSASSGPIEQCRYAVGSVNDTGGGDAGVSSSSSLAVRVADDDDDTAPRTADARRWLSSSEASQSKGRISLVMSRPE
jgi:hypothetical protein